MSAQPDSKCVIDMSDGCKTWPVPNASMRKPVFIPRTKRCHRRSKLPRRYFSSRTILRCSMGGPPRTMWRLRPTARCSPVRSDRHAMSTQTGSSPAERAAEYLERIAGLTGAKLDDDGTYHLTAGRMQFRVDYKFVISQCGKS